MQKTITKDIAIEEISAPTEIAQMTQKPQNTQIPVKKQIKISDTAKPLESIKATEISVPTEKIITVKAIDNNGVLQLNAEVPFNEGSSVFDYLLEAGKNEKIVISYSGGKSSAYVEGINNLFEFDRGAESGWIYTVDNIKFSVGSAKTYPNAGSVIVWKYILKVADGLS